MSDEIRAEVIIVGAGISGALAATELARQGVKVALRDNVMVENKLSKKGMICLDDMSHEIYTLGSEYDAAKNLLCTFKLSAPVGGYEKKVLKKHDEVESKAGFIGAEMEEFLQKIL